MNTVRSKTRSKGRLLTFVISTMIVGSLFFWMMPQTEVQNRSPAQNQDLDSKRNSENVNHSDINETTSESLQNSVMLTPEVDSENPFPDLNEVSQETFINEALNPKQRTLSQRSMILRTIENGSKTLESPVIREIALQQMRGPLPSNTHNNPDAIYDFFFRAAGLFLEQGEDLSQNTEELAYIILAQSSMVGRKAILVRSQLMNPDQFTTLVKILNKKGIHVPPSLEGTPSENLPTVEATSN